MSKTKEIKYSFFMDRLIVVIAYLVALIAGLLFVRAMWLQFRERTLDPLADKAGDQLDHVNADLAERRGRVRRWLDSWKSK